MDKKKIIIKRRLAPTPPPLNTKNSNNPPFFQNCKDRLTYCSNRFLRTIYQTYRINKKFKQFFNKPLMQFLRIVDF